MKSILYISLCTLCAVSFADRLKSPVLVKQTCDAVRDYLEKAEPSHSFDEKKCATEGVLEVVAESKGKFSGDPVVVTIGDTKVADFKEGDALTIGLNVNVSYDKQVCRVTLTRSLPGLRSVQGKILGVKGGWIADVVSCELQNAQALLDADLGDKNVTYVPISKLPKKVRSTMNEYDLIPLVGHDGYYGLMENAYAKVTGKDGKILGYLELALFSYTEDPEVHFWLFRYNADGKLAEIPEDSYAKRGDDVDMEGATKEWVKTGKLDR
jgi:hypothetical protein